MVKVCFLNDCQNKLKKGTVLKSGRADRKFLRFHPSPKDPVLKAAWDKSLGRTDRRSYDVCSDHFEDSDYIRSDIYRVRFMGYTPTTAVRVPRLLNHAVPKLNITGNTSWSLETQYGLSFLESTKKDEQDIRIGEHKKRFGRSLLGSTKKDEQDTRIAKVEHEEIVYAEPILDPEPKIEMREEADDYSKAFEIQGVPLEAAEWIAQGITLKTVVKEEQVENKTDVVTEEEDGLWDDDFLYDEDFEDEFEVEEDSVSDWETEERADKEKREERRRKETKKSVQKGIKTKQDNIDKREAETVVTISMFRPVMAFTNRTVKRLRRVEKLRLKGVTIYRCSVCCYETPQKARLAIHFRSHSGEKPFGCDTCGKKFSCKGNLATHSLIHKDVRKFECGMCPYKSTSKQYIGIHRLSHTGERPHKCLVCGYCCSSEMDLARHTNRHTGDKPYSCDYEGCLFKSYRGYGMTRHKRRFHPTDDTDLLACAECDFKTTNLSYLTEHQKMHDIIRNGEELRCEYCPYKTPYKSALTRHSKSCWKRKCDQCGFETLKMRSFTAHKKKCKKFNEITQAGEELTQVSDEPIEAIQPREGPDDDKVVKITNLYKKNKQASFSCGEAGCSFKFTTEGALVIHVRTHTGEKPYQCEYCEYRGRSEALVKSHKERCKSGPPRSRVSTRSVQQYCGPLAF